MKHAGAAALDRLEPLLARLRSLAGLNEKSRGTFYRGSRAFLHFHEDGDDFHADVRFEEDFERLPATTAAQQTRLLKRVAAALGAGKPKP